MSNHKKPGLLDKKPKVLHPVDALKMALIDLRVQEENLRERFWSIHHDDMFIETQSRMLIMNALADIRERLNTITTLLEKEGGNHG